VGLDCRLDSTTTRADCGCEHTEEQYPNGCKWLSSKWCPMHRQPKACPECREPYTVEEMGHTMCRECAAKDLARVMGWR
jgi:hypothetical protein